MGGVRAAASAPQPAGPAVVQQAERVVGVENVEQAAEVRGHGEQRRLGE